MSLRRPSLSPATAGAILLLSLSACRDATPPVAPTTRVARAVTASTRGLPNVTMLGAPVFGLDAAPDGSLLAAVSSSGLVGIRANGVGTIATLPGLNGVAAIGSGEAFVVTGGSLDPAMVFPTSRKIFRVSNGHVREIADLWAYEQAVNPDQVWNTGALAVESNPFGVALLQGGRALVADAAANDVVIVEPDGTVDWVAVLTPVSNPGPEPVPTAVAVGPDGDYYVGELTGFPATPGLSRVWRIAAGSRHVLCPSTACTLAASGFTSIMGLAFGTDGTLYVVEFDEASWLGVQNNGFAMTQAGGTVDACDIGTGACSVLAGQLSLPTAITVDRNGAVWITEHVPMLFAAARVRRIQ